MGADEASGFLPVLKEDHGGNAPHLIPNRDIGIHIDVEFQKDSVLPVVLGDLVQYRSHSPARTAPGRPEVHKDRLFRLEDDVFKLSLGNVAYATAHRASLSQSFANVRQNVVASSDRWSYTFRVDLKSILKEVLALHDKWVVTEGKEGTRLSVRNAILQEADLHGANLQDADLEGARLSVADLMKANLRRANFRNADFWMADMKDAILQGTDLQGANLSDVTNLTQKQVDSAITNDSTVLPAGLRRN